MIWGCVSQTGEQAVNVGRNAVLAAGWPEDVVGMTIDRQCGSSQQAVHFAAAGVIAGHYDIAVAGGVESMSRVPMLSPSPRVRACRSGRGCSPATTRGGLVPQGVSAEIIAERWGCPAPTLDEIAVRSHANAAAAATEAGAFARASSPRSPAWSADEGIRRGTDARHAGRAAHGLPEDGVVTAGNSSQISDGAAALLVTTSRGGRAARLAPAGPGARGRRAPASTR